MRIAVLLAAMAALIVLASQVGATTTTADQSGVETVQKLLG